MVDVVDPATRSRMMSGIRCKNTKPEILVRKYLHGRGLRDRKSTRLNSSHVKISYAVFCLISFLAYSTLYPYTTLFRSGHDKVIEAAYPIFMNACGMRLDA